MIFQHFLLIDANESNIYVVGCPETRKAVLIDAGAFDERVVSFFKQHHLTVNAILLTHDHWDHIGGQDAVQRWQRNTGFNSSQIGSFTANGAGVPLFITHRASYSAEEEWE